MTEAHRLFREVLVAFSEAKEMVQLGGVPFDPAADILIRSVGEDYVLIELRLGGRVREISVPFAAIQYVTAKQTGSFLAS